MREYPGKHVHKETDKQVSVYMRTDIAGFLEIDTYKRRNILYAYD